MSYVPLNTPILKTRNENTSSRRDKIHALHNYLYRHSNHSHVSRTKFTACAHGTIPNLCLRGKRKSYRREHGGMLASGDETPRRVSILHLSAHPWCLCLMGFAFEQTCFNREAANELKFRYHLQHTLSAIWTRNTDGIPQKRFNFVVE